MEVGAISSQHNIPSLPMTGFPATSFISRGSGWWPGLDSPVKTERSGHLRNNEEAESSSPSKE